MGTLPGFNTRFACEPDCPIQEHACRMGHEKQKKVKAQAAKEKAD